MRKKPFRPIVFGKQYVDISAVPYAGTTLSTSTSIPATISLSNGSVLSLFKSISPSHKLFAVPIVGCKGPLPTIPSDPYIYPIYDKHSSNPTAILLASNGNSKYLSFTNSRHTLLGDYSHSLNLILDSEPFSTANHLHIMYADDLCCLDNIINVAIARSISVSLDFCSSKSLYDSSNPELISTFYKNLSAASYIFYSDHECAETLELIKSSGLQSSILFTHSPSSVQVFSSKFSFSLTNDYYNPNYMSTTGAGDFFALSLLHHLADFHQPSEQTLKPLLNVAFQETELFLRNKNY